MTLPSREGLASLCLSSRWESKLQQVWGWSSTWELNSQRKDKGWSLEAGPQFESWCLNWWMGAGLPAGGGLVPRLWWGDYPRLSSKSCWLGHTAHLRLNWPASPAKIHSHKIVLIFWLDRTQFRSWRSKLANPRSSYLVVTHQIDNLPNSQHAEESESECLRSTYIYNAI